MFDKKIAWVIIISLLIFVIIFGSFFVMKNGVYNLNSFFKYLKKDINSLELSNEKVKKEDGEENKVMGEMTALKEELAKNRKSIENFIAQFSEVKSLCTKDLYSADDLTESNLKKINSEEVSKASGDYFSCEATLNSEVSACSPIKNLENIGEVYNSCVERSSMWQLATDHCSDDSLNNCYASGLISKSQCDNFCNVMVKKDKSFCNILSADNNVFMTCLAIANDNIKECNSLTVNNNIDSCLSTYYTIKSFFNKDKASIDKITDEAAQKTATIFLDSKKSCSGEFSGVIRNLCNNVLASYIGSKNFLDLMQKTTELSKLISNYSNIDQKINDEVVDQIHLLSRIESTVYLIKSNE